ncbi:MAG: FAD-binding oxidoreductase [Anaerolineae bacterium]
MLARSIEGQEIEIKQEALDAFKKRLRGPLIRPGEPGYEEARTVWNAMIDRKPAAVVRCLGSADVIASVQFARENNMLLCIKGGGHNIGGLAAADGALMLDMSLMRGVWVDPHAKIAHVQAGSLLGDVDRETQLHGLATVLGFVSATGVAGLTLGGGLGYLTRRFGWTADNVTGMDLVTAEGKLVHAADDENADLFWALRGGGGNFGVVTSFNYKLYPVGPEIVGGVVAWPASDMPQVLEFYRTFSAQAPAELTLAANLRPAPAAPWLPKEWHAKPVAMLIACYTGDPAQGEKIVAPIKAFGKPIGDILVRRPYVQQQSLLDATQPKGRRYYWKSEYLPGVTPELNARLVESAARISSPNSAIVLFHLDGALNRLDDLVSPVGNRDARYVVTFTASWEQPADDAAQIAWAREAWNAIKPFSTGGNYINFQTADDQHERIEAAYGFALTRLRQVKARWDPDNFFRANRNILPAL